MDTLVENIGMDDKSAKLQTTVSINPFFQSSVVKTGSHLKF